MRILTKAERVRTVLAGGRPDHTPFSIWCHFGSQHLPPLTTASLHLEFFRSHDLDWLKVMSDYRYPMPPGLVEVTSARDLGRFTAFGVDAGPLSVQLSVLRHIAAELGDQAAFVETVFSPWGVAFRTLRSHATRLWRDEPTSFKSFLESVTESLQNYVRAVARAGASGVFYSINGVDETELSQSEFEEWVKPYDLAVLDTAYEMARQGYFFFNVAHLHGHHLRWKPVLESYPCHAFNWAMHHTAPSLQEARATTQRCLIAGLDEVGLTRRSPSEVRAQVLEAMRTAGEAAFMVGPGCAVQSETPIDLIAAAREACRAARS